MKLPQRMIGVLLATAAQAMPALAKEPCRLDPLEVPVTMVGSRAIAQVAINGVQVPLMVDSGAFFSMLTPAAADQLQLLVKRLPGDGGIYGLTGAIDVGVTKVKSLQLPKGEVPNLEFAVGGNEPGSGAMGMMGRNILSVVDTEYDLAHGVIRLILPRGDCKGRNMAYWAGDSPVVEVELLPDASSSSRWQPAIRATAQLNGKDLTVLFDTGAPSAVVSLSAARSAGIDEAAMKPTRPVHGAGRGEAKSWFATFGRFALGGEVVSNSRLLVSDFETRDQDMLLGIDFFLAHRIYVSKLQRRMFFTYSGGSVFANSRLPEAQGPQAADAAASAAASATTSAAAEPADAEQPTSADGFARRGAASAARQDFVHALADLDKACQMAEMAMATSATAPTAAAAGTAGSTPKAAQAAEYFRLRLEVHAALKQWPQALQDADTALRLDPALSAARLARAELRAGAGDRDAALEDLGALDKTVAPQAQLRLAMAQLYSSLDHLDLALPEWNFWIAAHRDDVELGNALNSRCWARAMLAVELDKAKDDCDEAVDGQSGNASFLDTRGWLHLRRGEFPEALADYDSALKIRPDSAWSLYGRGIARMKLGDAKQADPARADIAAARKLLPAIDATAGRYGLAFDKTL